MLLKISTSHTTCQLSNIITLYKNQKITNVSSAASENTVILLDLFLDQLGIWDKQSIYFIKNQKEL